MYLTVFVGSEPPKAIDLEQFDQDMIWFGRSERNDIVLRSKIVSSVHGCFKRKGGSWSIADSHSTNGLFVNECQIQERMVSDGLKVYIGSEDHGERVLFLFTAASSENVYQRFSLDGRQVIRIGREDGCDIRLKHISVSRSHAQLYKNGDGNYYLKPEGKSQVRCNGSLLEPGGRMLSDMDRFVVGNTHFIYRAGELIYYSWEDGMGLEVSHLFKKVPVGKGKKTIVEDVSFQVESGGFVAIVGGSGAGKSSLIKCISGCAPFTEGTVLIQGEDIQSGYDEIKRMVGYVPQQDIVYDDLTLERMLYYSACLRMPKDAGAGETKKRIEEVIRLVELEGHEKTLIRQLSGGQKKRASIAVELLSDPGIFFLDEPTSGLDPGTEKHLMVTLKNMAAEGRTVVLVTHTPLNLHLCDKVIFMGYGGRLCYCGGPQGALEFFGVDDFVDIYNKVQADPEGWRQKFVELQADLPASAQSKKKKAAKHKAPVFRQMGILSRRYGEMMVNDKRKLLLQLSMAPILGALLYVAFTQDLHPFLVASDTQTFGLALSCCCFWIGLFQSIQEISKERTIMERERMADLKSLAYLGSKVLVLGGLLLFQVLLLIASVWIFIGHPEEGTAFGSMPFAGYLLTAWLTAFSAAGLGLLVSALVKTTDQAVSVAPFLLIPQILFADIICGLSGIAEKLSYLVGCRWSCLAYGALAGINDLANEYGRSWTETSEVTDFYYAKYDSVLPALTLSNPAPKSWLILSFLALLFLVGALAALSKRREI